MRPHGRERAGNTDARSRYAMPGPLQRSPALGGVGNRFVPASSRAETPGQIDSMITHATTTAVSEFDVDLTVNPVPAVAVAT